MTAAATELATFHTLRQQHSKRAGRPNLALSDFVAPLGTPDHIGGFVVTAGPEEVEISARFDRANDNYAAIMVKALADRMAEAMAEALHRPACAAIIGAMRRTKAFTAQELIAEPYCRHFARRRATLRNPTTPKKRTLFKLLDAEEATGVTLTESMAMWPGSSVSGLYMAHPDSYYFWRGKGRTRPSCRLCCAQGHGYGRGGALAGPGAELRPQCATGGRGRITPLARGARGCYPSGHSAQGQRLWTTSPAAITRR